jgi:uncharacterized protein YcbX
MNERTTLVGHVRELWRFPVKSMQGERLDRATHVGTGLGIVGDRGWAVRAESVGEIQGGKKIATLLQCAARYVEEPIGGSSPHVEITLPDGATVRSDDPLVHDALSGALGTKVTLWPRRPADDDDHYRRRGVIDEAEMRRQFALADDEPLPDFSGIPAAIMQEVTEFVSPRGTYFDSTELHLLTDTSVATLAALAPDSRIDVRRFRPNFFVDCRERHGFPEIEWFGRRMRIGDVEAEVVMIMQRCVMAAHAQADLPYDRSIIRTLVRETGMNLGIGLNVVTPAPVAPADPVELLD